MTERHLGRDGRVGLRETILHPAVAALALGLGSLILFGWNVTEPVTVYFDETHYVPAARALLTHSQPVNIEHPLFAKTMMAAAMLLFGDNSLGWRMASVLFGAIAVMAMFWVSRLLFRDLKAAMLSALLLVCNQTLFIQARIGMLEMPMVAGILLGAGCLLAARESECHRRGWEIAGAVALGLACGSKWLAAPYALCFVALYLWDSWRRKNRDGAFLVDHLAPDAIRLLVVIAVTYFATFWPAFFYDRSRLTFSHLIGFQFEMLRAQQAPLSPHPYQSAWWQWPLMLRPIWYLFAKDGDHYRAILLIGNPAVYWGGLGIMAAALTGWIKRRSANLNLTATMYVFSLAIWLLIPKHIGFFYYYNLSAIVLGLVIVSFLHAQGPRGIRVLGWFTALAAVIFVYFYPIISASPLPIDDTWTDWVWMSSWR